jgi:hypothetical protein
MSAKKPPEFTKDEIILIKATFKERYGHDVEVQLADAEIRLNPAIPELTHCPIAFSTLTGRKKNVSTICLTALSACSKHRPRNPVNFFKHI